MVGKWWGVSSAACGLTDDASNEKDGNKEAFG